MHIWLFGRETNRRKMGYTSTAGTGRNHAEEAAKWRKRERVGASWFAWQCCAGILGTRMCNYTVPSDHVGVVVDWDVRPLAVVVWTKVTVRCTKPLVKSAVQRQMTWPVTKMPRDRSQTRMRLIMLQTIHQQTRSANNSKHTNTQSSFYQEK